MHPVGETDGDYGVEAGLPAEKVMRVKLQWGESTKMATVSQQPTFSEICQVASRVHLELVNRSSLDFSIKYIDTDGDEMTVDSDDTLGLASSSCAPGTVLKLKVELSAAAEAAAAAAAVGSSAAAGAPDGLTTSARGAKRGAGTGNSSRATGSVGGRDAQAGEPSPASARPVCCFFLRGDGCRSGSRCQFSHTMPPGAGGRGQPRSFVQPERPPGFTSERNLESWLQRRMESPAADLIPTLSDAQGLGLLGDIISRPALSQPQADVLVRVLARDEMRSSMLRESTNRPDSALLPYVKLCEEIQSRSADGWREVPLDALKGRIEELPDECTPKQSLLADIRRLFDQRARLRVTSTTHGPPEPGLVGEAFRVQSIVPSVQEMHQVEARNLPHNHTAVPYQNVQQYLETHFQLLREDCMQPLKVGIRQYRNDTGGKKRSHDVRVYKDVIVAGLRCGRVGIEYRLGFHVDSGQRVNWEVSKRLMLGALLCISADNFETVQFAVVAKWTVEDLSRGFIDVRMIEEEGAGEKKGLCADRGYVMAESTASYFEAYLHVLRSLQRPDMEHIPFQPQLIHLEAQVAPPSYLRNRGRRDEYDFSCVFPGIRKDLGTSRVRILQEWPEWTSTLDRSQKEALRRALTKELALIQGPPGTGKTFVGLLAMKLLLANVSRASGTRLRGLLAAQLGDDYLDAEEVGIGGGGSTGGGAATGPILVVCYTNHALDQFLEGILEYEKSIVRIGGSCKSEALKRHNLQDLVFQQREARENERAHQRAAWEARSRSKELEAKIVRYIDRLSQETVTPESLEGVATEDQIYSLFCGDVFDGPPAAYKARAAQYVNTWLNEHRHLRQVAQANAQAALARQDAQWGHQENMFEALNHQAGAGARGWVEIEVADNDGDDDNGGEGSVGDADEVRELEADRQEGLAGGRRPEPEMHLLQRPLNDALLVPPPPPHPAPQAHARDPQATAREEQRQLQLQAALRRQGGGQEAKVDDEGFQEVRNNRRRGRHQQQTAVPVVAREPEFEDDEEEEEDEEWAQELGQEEVQLDDVVDHPNVWALPERARAVLHQYWLTEIRLMASNRLKAINEEYSEARRQVAEVENEIQLSLLRESRVVGTTTTAAARYHDLLIGLRPEIIVVEEAAEVLESHILACLTPTTQHLILIGDHQQLRPSVAVYALAKKHGLDVSMFERLMANGVEGTTLSVQHRMRPAIARLVAPIIYPLLQNHTDVRSYPEIRGVTRSLCFLDHRVPENHDGELGSKVNAHEVRLCVELCAYFLKQGYENSQVVILTMYTGQLLEIKRLLRAKLTRDEPWGQEMFHKQQQQRLPRVSSVDNYQGEECDIIILSLVRSNNLESHDGPGKIGFLGVANRVCVALSRARMGLFMLGNAQLLAAKSPQLWGRVLRELREQGCVAPSITLRCQNHEDTLTEVSESAHFKVVEDGGCSKPCEFQLDCGHACPRRCHPGGHNDVACFKECKRELPACQHLCNARCHGLEEGCPPCARRVQKTMPECGHVQTMACSAMPEDHRCAAKCAKVLACGHACDRQCFQLCTERCPVLVDKAMPCGHRALMPCSHAPEDFLCQVPCREKLADCGHECVGTCGACKQGTQHVPCQQACQSILPCGDACMEKCASFCPPCWRRCQSRCRHARCRRKCGEPCLPCREPCSWRCAHFTCEHLCHEACTRPRCDAPCTRRLRCGHPCIGLCGEMCPTKCRTCHPDVTDTISLLTLGEAEADDRFVQLEDCGHLFEVSGLDQWMDMPETAGTLDAAVDGGAANIAVKLKECSPACRTAIRRTGRYSNVVKERVRRLEAVKAHVNGFAAVNRGNELLAEGNPSLAERSFRQALRCNPRLAAANHGLGRALTGRKHHQEGLPHFYAVARSSPLRDVIPAGLEAIVRGEGRPGATPAGNLPASGPADAALGIEALLLMAESIPRVRAEMFAEVIKICDAVLSVRPDNLQAQVIKTRAEHGERAQVVQAMALEVGGKGHWYECPNGHFYTIGECGGAMERSHCPDCGAVVGGERHAIVAGNRHSTIDGSAAPAWGNHIGLGAFA
eukprot:jgi/Mesen1/9680/ME000680S09086